MSEDGNNIKQLMEAFSTPTNPVSSKEFKEFWTSLSPAEKVYYKAVALG